MKICVTAHEDDLDALIDSMFGRCDKFLIIDLEKMEIKGIDNPHISASGGAGIQAAQLIASEGVEVLLTGNVGPNAFKTLSALHIEVYIGANGTVRKTIADYKSGQLKKVTEPSVAGHYGQGSAK